MSAPRCGYWVSGEYMRERIGHGDVVPSNGPNGGNDLLSDDMETQRRIVESMGCEFPDTPDADGFRFPKCMICRQTSPGPCSPEKHDAYYEAVANGAPPIPAPRRQR